MSATAELRASPLGQVPSDWRVVRVDEAGQVLGGRQRSPSAAGEPTKYLRVANVFDGYIDTSDVLEMPFTAAERDRFALRDGDILLNEGQSLELVGRSAIFRGQVPGCVYQNTLIRFRANKGVVPEFVQAVFHRYVQSGVFAGIALQTTSIAHLGVSRLASLALPLPDEGEQRAIAEAITDIDAQLAALDQLISKQRDVKLAAMQQLLTGRTRLPGHSGQWRSSSIGAFADVIRGVTYRGDSDLYPYGHPSSVVLLRANNVRDASINLDEVQFVDEACVADVQLLRLNDILICMANGSRQLVGKAARLNESPVERLTFGAFMGCLRVRPAEADVRFVAQLLQTLRYRNYVANLLAGSSINNLRPGDVAAMEFDMPPLTEQRAIAGALADMDTEFAALEARREKTRQLKQGMMQALLTGRIRLM
jgi:type I restriction enzyme S subunit